MVGFFFLFLEIRTRSLRSSGVDKIKQLCAPMTADTLNHWLLEHLWHTPTEEK